MYIGLIQFFTSRYIVVGCFRYFLLFGMFRLVRSFPLFQAGRLGCSVSCFSVVVFCSGCFRMWQFDVFTIVLMCLGCFESVFEESCVGLFSLFLSVFGFFTNCFWFSIFQVALFVFGRCRFFEFVFWLFHVVHVLLSFVLFQLFSLNRSFGFYLKVLGVGDVYGV